MYPFLLEIAHKDTEKATKLETVDKILQQNSCFYHKATKLRKRERDKKEKRIDTCKPLPIIRLTALFPPPPTPTTLILAESIGVNELEMLKR